MRGDGQQLAASGASTRPSTGLVAVISCFARLTGPFAQAMAAKKRAEMILHRADVVEPPPRQLPEVDEG